MTLAKTIAFAKLTFIMAQPAMAAVCDPTPTGHYTHECLLLTAQQKRVQGMRIMCEDLLGIFDAKNGSCAIAMQVPSAPATASVDSGGVVAPGEFVVTNESGMIADDVDTMRNTLQDVGRMIEQNEQLIERMNTELSIQGR